MNKYYLGIDTSNYTTSVAAVDEIGRVFFDKRRILAVEKGERGLRQSKAVFEHINNLPDMFDKLGKEAVERGLALGGVGVSVKPRPVEGSYMPCFLPGVTVASVISEINRVPLYNFSHQEGHLAAALYGNEELIRFNQPYLAYHLSGGTTEILLCKGNEVREIAGKTKDLSLGQLIDRTGVAMGLNFPCGREMDEMAMKWSGKTKNPFCRIKVEEGMMNISGIETQVQRFASAMNENTDKKALSNWVLTRCGEAIIDSIYQLTKKYDADNVLFMGGVSSSSLIRKFLLTDFKPENGKNTVLYFGKAKYCSDNAVGTALLARLKADEK